MQNRKDQAYWQSVMQAQTESGLNKQTFCTERGIKPATFYYWQRRLRALEQDESEAGFGQVILRAERDVKAHELSLHLSSGSVVVRSPSLAALSQVLQALSDA